LKDLRENAYWVQFAAPEFRSGPTILLKIEKNRLLFDLPRPWNPLLAQARVIYRDREHIMHSFRVKILKTDPEEKVVVTTYPKEIFRLERRSFYRISVPEGSEALFKHRKQELLADVLNISGSGMAILTKKGNSLIVGEEIEDITLNLMLSTGKPFEPIKIARARIVREQPRDRGRKLYGVQFLLEREKDREPIIKYTLKRELEMRKASRH
jgi:c-di-GMP-binding flagellar brake protein YcgR